VLTTFKKHLNMANERAAVITLPGVAQSFHGSAFEFLRKSALDAETFLTRNRLRSSAITSGILCGPIRKTNLFLPLRRMRERLVIQCCGCPDRMSIKAFARPRGTPTAWESIQDRSLLARIRSNAGPAGGTGFTTIPRRDH